MVNEDKREFMTETHDHFARTWPGLSERSAQSKLRLAPAGMTTIEIAPRRRYMETSQLKYSGRSKSCNTRALGRGRA